MRPNSARWFALGGPDFDDIGFHRALVGSLGAGTVCEFGSGVGRLLLELADVAPRSQGVEVEAEYVAAARAEALRRGLAELEFVAGDLRTPLQGLRPASLVVAGWNTFQAMVTDQDIAAFFDNAARVGERLCLTAFHPRLGPDRVREIWSRGFETTVWAKDLADGTRVVHREICQDFDLEPLVLRPRLVWDVIHADGRRERVEFPIAMRCHTPDALRQVVVRNGFEIEAAWGGYAGEEYGQGSQLVILARNAR